MQLLIQLFLLSTIIACSTIAAPKMDIPKASWEPIYFESINSLTQDAGWTPLRQSEIPKDTIEVRVWIGFGLGPLEGIRIYRVGQKWSGFYARYEFNKEWTFKISEVTPSGEWIDLWKKLLALDILTLPDSSTLPRTQNVIVCDGVGYVVEINDGKIYRTYEYSNPSGQNWRESKKIEEIIDVLYKSLIYNDKLFSSRRILPNQSVDTTDVTAPQ